jgi:FLVCR family MFS transporter 7
MATSVLSVINLIGTGIGFLLPGLIVGEDATGQRDKIRTLLLIEALIIVPSNLITIVFMRSKPPTPPRYKWVHTMSISAQVSKKPFMEALTQLSTNKDYILLLLMFSLVLGNFNTFSTLVQNVIEPYGYTDVDASVLGGMLIGCGVVGATVFSLIVEQRLNYKQLLLICCGCGLLSTGWVMVALNYEYSFVVFSLGIAGIGLFLLPVLPLSFELACECSFPVGEAVAAGMLMTGG